MINPSPAQKTTKITVWLEKSGPTVLEGAILCGRFAVHESTKFPNGQHWVITHIASGMRVGGFNRTMHAARKIADSLDAIGSRLWSFKVRPPDERVLNQLRLEAIAAGVTFNEDNFAARVEGQNNAVNQARMIGNRFAERRDMWSAD